MQVRRPPWPPELWGGWGVSVFLSATKPRSGEGSSPAHRARLPGPLLANGALTGLTPACGGGWASRGLSSARQVSSGPHVLQWCVMRDWNRLASPSPFTWARG